MDVYLTHVEATTDDLGNQTNPMVTKAQATALAMDQATLQCKMTLDPLFISTITRLEGSWPS